MELLSVEVEDREPSERVPNKEKREARRAV